MGIRVPNAHFANQISRIPFTQTNHIDKKSVNFGQKSRTQLLQSGILRSFNYLLIYESGSLLSRKATDSLDSLAFKQSFKTFRLTCLRSCFNNRPIILTLFNSNLVYTQTAQPFNFMMKLSKSAYFRLRTDQWIYRLDEVH